MSASEFHIGQSVVCIDARGLPVPLEDGAMAECLLRLLGSMLAPGTFDSWPGYKVLVREIKQISFAWAGTFPSTPPSDVGRSEPTVKTTANQPPLIILVVED